MAAGKVLGFIGLGRMGTPMAGRLMDAGHDLAVFDTADAAMAPPLARGARRCASPAGLAPAAAPAGGQTARTQPPSASRMAPCM